MKLTRPITFPAHDQMYQCRHLTLALQRLGQLIVHRGLVATGISEKRAANAMRCSNSTLYRYAIAYERDGFAGLDFPSSRKGYKQS